MTHTNTAKNRIIVSIALVVAITLTLMPFAPITARAASGEATYVTSSNYSSLGLTSSYVGYYAIESADQLLWFAEQVNAGNTSYNGVLLNDIDLTEVTAWTMMDTYYGIFDGRMYSIIGLSANASIANEHHYGFIKTLSGTVKNVIFDDAYVDTQSDIGNGIIAYNNSGTISGCMVINSYITLGNYAGLGFIAGKNLSGGVIENCGAANSEMARRYSGWNTHTLGGITQANNGTVNNCYTYNCTFTNGTSANGALISSGNAPTNSYYYTNSTTVSVYGTSKTADAFKGGEVAVLLGSAFGQNIDNWNVPDDYPIVSGPALYSIYYCHNSSLFAGYSNTNGAKGHQTYSSDGFCTSCGAYQPGTLVTSGNCSGLNLTEAHVGYWAIGNAGQLYWFAAVTNGSYNNKTQNTSVKLVLSTSITVNSNVLDSSGSLNSGGTYRDWIPAGNSSPYAGTFDGNGKTISGLYLVESSSYGLFSGTTSDAVIKNVGVTDSYLNNVSSYSGGIVAKNEGTVMNCYYAGVISGSTSYVGGIVGWNNNGTVKGCYNTSSVSGSAYIGGIVGRNSGDVENCYNTGTVTSGIVGLIDSYGTITNCYNTGTVSYGIVRSVGNGTVTNCYYLDDNDSVLGGIGSKDVAGQAEARTTAAFAGGEVTYLLQQGNTEQVWGQNIDNGSSPQAFPVFSSATVYARWYCDNSAIEGYSNTEGTIAHSDRDENYENGFCIYCEGYQPATLVTSGNYSIGNAGQLYWFAQHVNAGNTTINAVVTADINAAVSQCKHLGIGTETILYSGDFDGGNHTITLSLEGDSQSDSIGLFKFIGGAAIYDLHTTGTINAPYHAEYNQYAAGVVSRVLSGTNSIERVTSDVIITSGISGDGTHGGLVGVVDGNATLTLNNCGFSGAIDGSSTYACGGLIGWNSSSSLAVTNCYQAGTFTLYNQDNATVNRGTAAKTLTNVYYLNAIGTAVQGTAKSQTQFESGEVAYLLQGSQGTQVWGQNIDNGNTTEALPVLSSATVYQKLYCDGTLIAYSNTEELVHVWNYEAPSYTWADDHTSLTVTLPCTKDSTHTVSKETTDINVDTTDPNWFVYTGTVVLDDQTYTDTVEVFNEIISVDITWSELTFVYTIKWNPESLQYEGVGWDTVAEDGGVITVTNAGNVDVNISFAYTPIEAGVVGSFTDEENTAVTSPVALAVDEKKKIKLTLSGEPSKTFEAATLGNVTVTVANSP